MAALVPVETSQATTTALTYDRPDGSLRECGGRTCTKLLGAVVHHTRTGLGGIVAGVDKPLVDGITALPTVQGERASGPAGAGVSPTAPGHPRLTSAGIRKDSPRMRSVLFDEFDPTQFPTHRALLVVSEGSRECQSP